MILTTLQLQRIENQANTQFEFKFYGVRLINNDKHHFTQVLRISDENNLIMFKGNLYSGYEHIIARHIWWSIDPFIEEKDRNKSFTKQGRFPKEISPLELIEIADEIYSKENLNTNKNKNPDDLDLYIGSYEFDKRNEEIWLFLYKGTKIIHTMYIKSDRYKKPLPKHFNFFREKVEINTNASKKEIFVPYIDSEFNIRYCFHIEKNILTKKENLSILVFKENVYNFHLEFGERQMKMFPYEKSEELFYQHGDLRPVERKIMEIDESIKLGSLSFKH